MFLGRWGDLFVVMGVASPHRRSNRHSSDGPARATFRRLHSRVGAHHTFAPCDPSSGTGRSVKKKDRGNSRECGARLQRNYLQGPSRNPRGSHLIARYTAPGTCAAMSS